MIKNRLSILILTLFIISCGPKMGSPKPAEVVHHRKPITAKDLTLREQIAQMIMVRIEGYYYAADNSYRQKLERWVRDDKVGGLITFRGSVDGTFTNLQSFQRLAETPLLIAADFERGVGQQVLGATSFPPPMAVAATYDEQNAYEQGRITALEARALGIHVTFAPVMDVNNNPLNPIINFRSYSDDPEIVARMGQAFIRGAQEYGLIACAKHYPGHGNTATDSHTALPVIPGDRAALDKMELLPFRAAVEAGVKMVMVGHIVVPGLDDSNRPATQSYAITRGLLRDQYGFDGLIVTDGMEMGAIADQAWSGEATIRAIEAGNDIILLPLYVDQTIDAIERAVNTGRLSRDRIEESVNRILAAKAEMDLFRNNGHLDREAVRQQVGLTDAAEVAKKVARESITLVKDDAHLIPIKPSRRNQVMHFVLSMDDDLKERTRAFWQRVERIHGSKRIKTIFINEELNDKDIAELVAIAKGSNTLLVSTLVRIRMNKGIATIDSTHQALLEALNKARVSFVVASFGSPYMPNIKALPTYVASYGYWDLNMVAMVDALYGRAAITGRLPVDLDDTYIKGMGITRKILSDAFVPSKRRLNFERAYAVIDSAINDKVTPGAQLFVAQGGEMLVDTSFGAMTYDEGAAPVKKSSIYDLASVTKVLVGATIAMRLYEQKYMVLDEPISNYFPEFSGGWKDSVTIRHLLTHTSGLADYYRYWEIGVKPEDVLDHILHEELTQQPGTRYVYSDLGMILFTAIIERVTGLTLEELARKWVFDPLKITDGGYKPPAEWIDRIVPTEVDAEGRKGVIRGEVHDGNTWYLGGVSAHAGAFATAHQLAHLGQLYIDGGAIFGDRFVQESTIAAFTKLQNIPEGSTRALAWDTPSRNGKSSAGDLVSESTVGHTGYTGTSIWIDLEHEVVMVLLTNRVHPTRENSRIHGIRRAFHTEVMRTILGLNPPGLTASLPQ